MTTGEKVHRMRHVFDRARCHVYTSGEVIVTDADRGKTQSEPFGWRRDFGHHLYARDSPQARFLRRPKYRGSEGWTWPGGS